MPKYLKARWLLEQMIMCLIDERAVAMKTPEEILNEVAAENMINIQQMVTTKQLVVIAMRKYAKLYHENKVKNLDIQCVSKRCDICGDPLGKPDMYSCTGCAEIVVGKNVC